MIRFDIVRWRSGFRTISISIDVCSRRTENKIFQSFYRNSQKLIDSFGSRDTVHRLAKENGIPYMGMMLRMDRMKVQARF